MKSKFVQLTAEVSAGSTPSRLDLPVVAVEPVSVISLKKPDCVPLFEIAKKQSQIRVAEAANEALYQLN